MKAPLSDTLHHLSVTDKNKWIFAFTGILSDEITKRCRCRKIRKLARMLLGDVPWTIWIWKKVAKMGGGYRYGKGKGVSG